LKRDHVVLILAVALSVGAKEFEAQGRKAAAVSAYIRSLALDGGNDHAKSRLAVLAMVVPK
jgi:hypothetical protein